MDLRDQECAAAESAPYLTAYMTLPFPVCIHDRERIVLVNHAAADAVGATAPELVGEPVDSVLHPDCVDASRTRREIETTTGRLQPSVLVKLNAANGSGRSHHVRNWRIRGGDAPLLGAAILPPTSQVAATKTPPTVRIQSDEGLERIAELALNTLPVPACIHDVETLLFVNDEACRLMKAPDRTMVEGRAVSDFVHPHGSNAGQERRRLVLTQGSSLHGVPVKLISFSGDLVYQTVSAFPLDVGERRLVLVVFPPRATVA